MSGSASGTATAPEVAEDQILWFPDGIPGFPYSHRFVLVEMAPDSPFQILQSADEPDVSLIVTVPWLFFPDYDFELSELEQRELGITSEEETVVFSAVTLDGEHHRVYLNLLGPIVVNTTNRRGRQVVLVDSDLPVRAPVELG
ncbi:MAG TPA: flagellar assembly protein FliW [Egibacteraceae bacterium]|nr:flagellar assembly protein FliW [Egibacteraceae bacterium]